MTKRYVFRLESVLKLRKRRQEERQRRVAEQLRKIAHAQAELCRVETELGGERDRARESQLLPSFDVSFVRRQRAYLSWLERRRVEGQQDLAALEVELRREQALLVQASTEVKALEKLRERQQTRAGEREHRAIRLEEDEFGRQAFLRNQPALAD